MPDDLIFHCLKRNLELFYLVLVKYVYEVTSQCENSFRKVLYFLFFV